MNSATLGLFLISSLSFAGTAKYVTLSPFELVKLHPGETVILSVKFKVDPGMHVQANPASRPQLKATVVALTKEDGVQVGAPAYPASKPFRMKGASSEIAIFDGDVEIKMPLTATPKAKAGKRKLKGELRYQACEESSCFFPMKLPLEVPVVVLE